MIKALLKGLFTIDKNNNNWWKAYEICYNTV